MKKGISPTVSFVLIVSIILIGSTAAYFWAAPLVTGIAEPGRVRNLKNQMVSLDYMLRATAHGDINFTNSYELYGPESHMELIPENDTLMLTFIQKASVIGRMNYTSNKQCTYSADRINHERTGIVVAREMNFSRVYVGSKGEGGDTEVMICYDNIDLKYGGVCGTAKTGAPRIIVYMKKSGFNATNNQSIVDINIC
jgi:hypothetical protein